MSMYKYFNGGIIGVFILCILFVVVVFFRIPSINAVTSDNVYGWAWSSSFGWISLNCYNYYQGILKDDCAKSKFGIDIQPVAGILTGYAWSSHFGWIDFQPNGAFPAGQSYSTRIGDDDLVRGWAKVLTLGDNGWINFQGDDCSTVSDCAVSGKAPAYVLDSYSNDGQSSLCYNCNRYKRSCRGGTNNGKSCDSNEVCGTGFTCSGPYVLNENGVLLCSLCFSGHGPNRCLEADTPSCTNGMKYPTGSICAVDPNLKETGDFYCSQCKEYASSPPNESEKIVSCGRCPRCYSYGVGLNRETNRLAGWAWNGIDKVKGIGWIQFDPNHTGVHGPWLETKFGGVYSQGSVGSVSTNAPPTHQFSATYEILAGGTITHFSTQSGNDFSQESFDDFSFPTVDTLYTNALGRLDFNGIYAGQYGRVIPIIFSTDIPKQLGGAVYHSSGSLELSSPLEFVAGDLARQNGAGLIIVEGDLLIRHNINYANLPVHKLKNLPSVAWIVKGDVVIDPSVTEVVGAFIILGNGKEKKCPALLASSNGCGRLSTGASSQPFDLYGFIMARQFNFQRNFFSTDRGSERFIYDGRALSNTPPGLGDLGQVLPIWKLDR